MNVVVSTCVGWTIEKGPWSAELFLWHHHNGSVFPASNFNCNNCGEEAPKELQTHILLNQLAPKKDNFDGLFYFL